MENTIWKIQKKEPSGKWFIVFSEPIDSSVNISAEKIYEHAKNCNIDNRLVSINSINEYLKKNLNTENIPLPFPLELEPTFDARITTNSDKTEAWLYVRKAAAAPNEIDNGIISMLLQKSNIRNLNISKIKLELQKFIESSDMELSILIAEGIPPKRGDDKKLEVRFEQVPHDEVLRLAERLKNIELRSFDVENPTTDKDFPLSEAETLTIVEKEDVLYELVQTGIGESGMDVYGNPIQGLPGNDPFLLDLRNIIQSHSQLRAAVTGLLLIANTERGLKLRIVPYRDAKVRAVISRDKMEASLILHSGIGSGERLSVDKVKAELKKLNLKHAIDDKMILEIIDSARKMHEETEYPILHGTPAIARNSYSLDWAVDFAEDSNITTIEKDSLILTAVSMPEGKDGVDVLGNTVDRDSAIPIVLPEYDSSIKMHVEGDKTLFFACISGELSRFDKKLSISSMRSIHSDIDERIGDVIFPGNLIITGDVKDGRKIKAKGELTITGNAEKSLIYSEESVVLNGGINGKGSGTVWAKKNITLRYAENARVFSGSDVKIEDYCFKCLIKTNGSVVLEGGRCVLLGGNVHAAQGLSVKDLGAEKTIRTIISFGQDYLIKDEIEVREQEIIVNNEKISAIDKKLKNLPPDTSAEKLHSEKVMLLKRNRALGIRIFNLKENFETHIPSKIMVTGTVYPGVILESHGRYFEVMEVRHNVYFEFDEKNGQIICLPNQEILS